MHPPVTGSCVSIPAPVILSHTAWSACVGMGPTRKVESVETVRLDVPGARMVLLQLAWSVLLNTMIHVCFSVHEELFLLAGCARKTCECAVCLCVCALCVCMCVCVRINST